MLLNILYYDQAAEAKAGQSTGGLTVGPLLITPQQVCRCAFERYENYDPCSRLDRHWSDRGNPGFRSEYFAGSILSAHSIATRSTTTVTITTSDL